MNDYFSPPNFGKPPNEYDPVYFAKLVQALVTLVQTIQTPGSVQATRILTTNLPTTTTDLKSGEFWNNGNVVNIV